MLPGATPAQVDPKLRHWLAQSEAQVQTVRSPGASPSINGRFYQGNSLNLIELEAVGISHVQARNPAGLLTIAIPDFGQCRGNAATRPFSCSAKRFAFLALPHERITLQISSPRASGLFVQLQLQHLLAECGEHQIKDPQPCNLDDTIPGHETLMLACARQLLELSQQPDTPARSRLQIPLEASIVSLLASLVPGSTAAQADENHALEPQAIHVQNAMRYLETHLSEPITLTMICQASSVSARTLQTSFQKLTQRTPIQMLHELRLKQLRELLLKQMDVRSACSQVGLQPTGRIAASYKRMFGELPRQTRMRARA